MKIKLLIASGDSDYAEHLSRVLADKYADAFEVSVCTTAERLRELLAAGKFDAALLEPDLMDSVHADAVRLPFVLGNESAAGNYSGIKSIRKHQRISSITGTVLENYAELGSNAGGLGTGRAHITAVWSPCGGVGKTSVALAYAARKVAGGKKATYLNLENFSSVPAFFPEKGKSISTVFEKLETDVPMLLMGIRQQDSGSGITYFCGPDNYDDMNILTGEDLSVLIRSGAAHADELVVDLSSQCDQRVWTVFDLADTILLVCDASATSQTKLRQFMTQHNISQRIQQKSVLVGNKGAKNSEAGIHRAVYLPFVQTGDAISVYKTLSGNAFEW